MNRKRPPLSKNIALLVEGNAERAIMDILLDNDKLIFNRDDMIEGKALRCRSAEKFQQYYMNFHYDGLSIVRILDSRTEQFNLKNIYKEKANIINVRTTPEIEMLIVMNDDKYDDYKKSRKKPSDYCIQDLGHKNVKSAEFIKKYFSDPDVLIHAIKRYDEVAERKRGEYHIIDLCKDEVAGN